MRQTKALLLFTLLAFTLFLTVLASQPVQAAKVRRVTAAACTYNCGTWRYYGCCATAGGYKQRQARDCSTDPGGLNWCTQTRCLTSACAI